MTQTSSLVCADSALPAHAVRCYSQYYTAFKDARAKELAINCFRAMDAAWHSSKFGAFDETPANSIPPAPSAAAVAAAAAAVPAHSKKRLLAAATHESPAAPQQQTRTLNVAMHGLEALTALHKITQGAVAFGS